VAVAPYTFRPVRSRASQPKATAQARRVDLPESQPSEETAPLPPIPYPVTLVREGGDEEPWIATIDALPGCVARGATPDETLERMARAVAEWVQAAGREGKDVPEPKSAQSHSGRLLLRMPQTLHAELSRTAEREKVSLNQFITDVLAGAMGWRSPGRKAVATRAVPGIDGDPVEARATDVAPAESRLRPRLVNAVFVANGVIVALAAVVAVIVLIVALH
jgi:antitoxin HicB